MCEVTWAAMTAGEERTRSQSLSNDDGDMAPRGEASRWYDLGVEHIFRILEINNNKSWFERTNHKEVTASRCSGRSASGHGRFHSFMLDEGDELVRSSCPCNSVDVMKRKTVVQRRSTETCIASERCGSHEASPYVVYMMDRLQIFNRGRRGNAALRLAVESV
ncbi:hypothetical protein F2P81_020705 [Scophthalmus maximus]|uniref:Uncharacterized protein n=1 Tax=Scophthalmus maximus TaxID=52904 RepID=A0A6A4SAZ5_SCOMX|nr:hypothetical protein F2P81_020705 [Scophthalmus maximus]